MKTSKIIFITLLGTIALLILAAMIDVRFTGQKRSEIFNNRLKVNKLDIPEFNVICLNNIKNLALVQSDSSYISMTATMDSITHPINYTIKEDTIWLSDFEKQNSRDVWIAVYFTNTLKSMQLKNSDLRITKFNSEKLSLDLNLDNSRVYFDADKSKNTAISVLNIVAKNYSYITANGFNVDSLGINLQNSDAQLQIIAKKISGTLSETSKIFIRQPGEISLKIDATSKITVNSY